MFTSAHAGLLPSTATCSPSVSRHLYGGLSFLVTPVVHDSPDDFLDLIVLHIGHSVLLDPEFGRDDVAMGGQAGFGKLLRCAAVCAPVDHDHLFRIPDLSLECCSRLLGMHPDILVPACAGAGGLPVW